MPDERAGREGRRRLPAGAGPQALAEDGRVGELELEVSILKDTVVVSGTVQNEARRQAVGEVLADLCPGYRILNETTVLRPATEPEEERLR